MEFRWHGGVTGKIQFSSNFHSSHCSGSKFMFCIYIGVVPCCPCLRAAFLLFLGKGCFLLFESYSKMFCAQILCNFLQFVDSGSF